jgi:hypothetical protein
MTDGKRAISAVLVPVLRAVAETEKRSQERTEQGARPRIVSVVERKSQPGSIEEQGELAHEGRQAPWYSEQELRPAERGAGPIASCECKLGRPTLGQGIVQGKSTWGGNRAWRACAGESSVQGHAGEIDRPFWPDGPAHYGAPAARCDGPRARASDPSDRRGRVTPDELRPWARRAGHFFF